MKRTNHINLNGQAFYIDEDACAKLQNYITTLERYYLKEEDGKEIMADIESRIAELFTEALATHHKEVISLADTDMVISVMGNPEDIIDEERPEVPPVQRKLYRDPDHYAIGGVAAGIAAYLNISPGWIRLIFLIFFFFSGVSLLIYIILWIVIPKAVTTRQKLEMQGEDANITNIEKKIRTTYNDISKNNKFQDFLKQTGKVLKNIFTALANALIKIISVGTGILAVIGLIVCSVLLVIFSILIFFPGFYGQGDLFTLVQSSIYPFPLILLKVILLIVVLIPLLLGVILSALRLFHFKNRRAGSPGVLGICLLVFFLFLLIASIRTFHFSIKHDIAAPLTLQPSDTLINTLFVKFLPAEVPEESGENRYLEDYIWNAEYQDNSDNPKTYFKPRINILKGKKKYPELRLQKTVREFIKNSPDPENLQYEYKWNGDTLYLAPYFTIEEPDWKIQNLQLRIYIPENYRIELINPPAKIMENKHIIRGSRKQRHNFSNPGQYQMTGKGLIKV